MGRLGVTLVELMIAVALICIGILAGVVAFKGIHNSIQQSKGRMLATNIAHEKLQILMQKSYYEVLVTTDPAFIVEGSSVIAYDPGYFPPETIYEGGIQFKRYTYIQVVQENSNLIEALQPLTPDTGIRQITETVIWPSESGDKFISVQNVLNNPNTVMSNSALTGIVTDALTTNPIPSALVNAAENVGWRDSASSAGQYFFNLSPGTFNFQASAPGYYSRIIQLTVPPNATINQAFALTPMSSGTIKGMAWLNNHVVISQIVPSTGPASSMEYVELYNPSTATFNMGTNLGYTTANIWPITFDASGGWQSRPELVYISTFIPANGFYLISNTGDGGGSTAALSCAPITVGGLTVAPDACWRFAGFPNHLLQCSSLPGGGGGCGTSTTAGGFGIGTNGGSIFTGIGNITKIDSLGWTGNGAAPTPIETAPAVPSSANGMVAGEAFVRRIDTTTTIGAWLGNAYDSGNNSVDFLDSTFPFSPRTHLTISPPVTGTPAAGAVVSVVDGLSVPSSATLAGNPPYAQFLVPGVATGTWTVFLDSGAASAEVDNVAVVGNSTSNVNGVILSTSGLIGIINGQVKNAGGTPLAGISVTAGAYTTTTNSSGNYSFRLSTGIYDVMANPGNLNALYAVQIRTPITVTPSDVTSNVNFQLSQGGQINGWISRDGTNPLPGVAVVALDSNSIAQDNRLSGNNGQFLLINLATGTYTVQPILDPKEIASPTSTSVTFTVGGGTVWAGTFTITGAMGTVTGNVTAGGKPISSGVLVVISTGALPVPLPALSSATLASSAYYTNASKEDGTFSVDVRSSTSTTYSATGFYMYLNNQTPVISSRTVSGITVTGGSITSGVNFSW